MIDLDAIFGYDDAAKLAVADPRQPNSPASVDAAVGHHLEYRDDLATDDDLLGNNGTFDEVVDTVDLWPGDDTVDLSPCESCGGLDLWETLTERWRCLRCDPPTKAIKTLGKAEKLRKRYGLPDPLGAA